MIPKYQNILFVLIAIGILINNIENSRTLMIIVIYMRTLIIIIFKVILLYKVIGNIIKKEKKIPLMINPSLLIYKTLGN